MRRALATALRPVRRKAATFALVNEERAQRLQHERTVVVPLAERITALEAAQRQVQSDAVVLSDRIADVLVREETVVRRVELVVSEVMHRAEAADARLATDLQKALDLLARQQRELAALTRTVTTPTALGPVVPEPMATNPYRAFGELERGTREEVAARVAPYVDLLAGRGRVVDLGCGRGEFLELATEAGLDVYGVDSDAEAVEACRSLGLKAEHDDVLEHLAALPDARTGGLLATHLVEHLPGQALWSFVAEVARVLAPGGVAVLETPNPSTLATHLGSFWRDPTHVRPVPAPALWWAARQAGLVVADTLYGHYPTERFERSGLAQSPDPQVRDLAQRHDALVTRLNDLLLGPQDYAVVLRKP